MLARLLAAALFAATLGFGTASPAHAGFAFIDDFDQMDALGVPICPDAGCVNAVITPDGHYITWVANYSGFSQTRLRYNRLADTLVQADVSSFAARYPFISDVTDDDRFVAFESDDDSLVSGDTNGIKDAFLIDRMTPSIERVSVNSSEQQALGSFFGSEQGSVSADGRFVVFQSIASNLAGFDNNNSFDVFLRDRLLGTTTLISEMPAGGGAVSPNGAQLANIGFLHSSRTISNDGRFVVFQGGCDLLPSGCPAGQTDAVLLRDRMTSTTSLVSKSLTGEPRFGRQPSISGDGNRIIYVASAGDIVAGDANNTYDFFVYDRSMDATTRISLDEAGNPNNLEPTVTNDGRRVVFSQFDGVVIWADCAAIAPTCGDGVWEQGCEECDDGNLIDGDGCDSNCTATRCGNNIQTAGEGCDDGNLVDGDGCDSNCTPTACGNGIRTAGEECEDGNLVDGDGCSSTCQLEGDQLTSAGKTKVDCLHEFLPLGQPPKPDGIFPVAQLTCTDDDPSCDRGASTGDQACTFRVAFCFNVADSRLECTASNIASIELKKPKGNTLDDTDLFNRAAIAQAMTSTVGAEGTFCTKGTVGAACFTNADCGPMGHCGKPMFTANPPLATPDACTAYADITVPLVLRSTGLAAGKRTISFRSSTGPDVSGKVRKDLDTLKLVCNP